MLRRGQVVFTYFHFAADENLTRSVLGQRHHGHRLRNSARPAAAAAPVDADERSRRPHEHPGRGEVPRAAPGGPRHLACGCAGRGARRGRHPGRRRRRLERRQGRRRLRGQCLVSWTSTSTACATSTTSCRRTSPPFTPTGTRSSTPIERADLVIGAVLITGRPGAPAGPRGGPQPHEVRLGHRRCGDRSGRLRRDEPADDPSQPDVPRRRRHSLLRHEHARRGRPDQHVCSLQRDAPLRARNSPIAAGGPWPPITRAWPTAST